MVLRTEPVTTARGLAMIRARHRLRRLQDSHCWYEVPFLIRWRFRLELLTRFTHVIVIVENKRLIGEAYWP